MKFDIKKILQNSSSQLKYNVINYPVEIVICIVYGVFLAWYFSWMTSHMRYVFAMTVPAVLFFNRFAKIKHDQRIYWIGSIISILLFFFIPWESIVGVSGNKYFYVSAILVILWSCFFFVDNEKTNNLFSEKIYHFFISMSLGFIYTGILAGLFELIYYSCQLLFNVPDDLITSEFRVYLWFYLVFPQFFLSHYSNEVRRYPVLHRVVEMLFTPAALIYTIILYLYFFKIIITTSFPEGMVAYMVIWYIGISILLQMNHLLITKSNKLYNWFYANLHYLFVFPMIMLAISTYKRIDAYGFTEDRVYLMYIGIFYLFYILFFTFPTTRKFRLLLPVLILLTVVATFTPRYNVYDLSIRSQTAKVEQILSENEMLDENGLLKAKEEMQAIPYDKYVTLTSALNYLDARGISPESFHAFSELKNSRKVINVYELKDLIPIRYKSEKEAEAYSDYLRNEGTPYKLSGYDTLLTVEYLSGIKHPVYAFKNNDDSLFVYRKAAQDTVYETSDGVTITGTSGTDSLLFTLNLSEHLKEVAENQHIDFSKEVSTEQLTQEQKEALFSMKKDPFKFIISGFYYYAYDNKDSLKITSFNIHSILIKEDKK